VWPTEYSLHLDPDGCDSVVAMTVNGVNAFTFGHCHRRDSEARLLLRLRLMSTVADAPRVGGSIPGGGRSGCVDAA